MDSIYNQSAILEGRLEFEHIIVDGLSKDRTPDVVEKHKSKNTTYIREKDNGMYDALAKGFRLCTGEIVCYLNSGDFYLPSAFDTIHSVFHDVGNKWFTAIPVHFGPQRMVTMADPPYRFRSDLIRKGAYGALLPYIQQESTFWKRELLAEVDLDRLSRFRLAGDYYLWWCFAQHHQLDVVHSILGGFSIQPGQLSENKDKYHEEVASFIEPIQWKDRINIAVERLGWSTSPYYRRKLNRSSIEFDYTTNTWSRFSRKIW
jgi:glycosyltransferase involved in cell wall biosynthesis